MKNKKYINRFISFNFSDRKLPVSGFLLDYTDEWTLLKYNPVDYVIEGYILLRNKNIKGYLRGADEKWKEDVLKLKGIQPCKEEHIPLDGIETILHHLSNTFGVFALYTKSKHVCYIGRLKSIDKKVLVMDLLNVKGKWDGEEQFKLNDIKVIEFDTDYINTLKLVLASRQ